MKTIKISDDIKEVIYLQKICVTCKGVFTTTNANISKCVLCCGNLEYSVIQWPEYYKFKPDSVNSFEDLDELLSRIVPHMDGGKIAGIERFFDRVNQNE